MDFRSIKKCLIKKFLIYLRKNLAITILFIFASLSKKRKHFSVNNRFLPLLALVTLEYRKNYKLVRSLKENGYFFSKKMRKTNNETNEQEQNITLNAKETLISVEHSALKGFPTNTIAKIQVFVSQLKTITMQL